MVAFRSIQAVTVEVDSQEGTSDTTKPRLEEVNTGGVSEVKEWVMDDVTKEERLCVRGMMEEGIREDRVKEGQQEMGEKEEEVIATGAEEVEERESKESAKAAETCEEGPEEEKLRWAIDKEGSSGGTGEWRFRVE